MQTVIRRETVRFYTFLNPPLVYIVKSPVIAQNYKDFFMMLWEMGEEATQHGASARLIENF